MSIGITAVRFLAQMIVIIFIFKKYSLPSAHLLAYDGEGGVSTKSQNKKSEVPIGFYLTQD